VASLEMHFFRITAIASWSLPQVNRYRDVTNENNSIAAVEGAKTDSEKTLFLEMPIYG
jgi:hypothetical protein